MSVSDGDGRLAFSQDQRTSATCGRRPFCLPPTVAAELQSPEQRPSSPNAENQSAGDGRRIAQQLTAFSIEPVCPQHQVPEAPGPQRKPSRRHLWLAASKGPPSQPATLLLLSTSDWSPQSRGSHCAIHCGLSLPRQGAAR